jgi:hypothetical protein
MSSNRCSQAKGINVLLLAVIVVSLLAGWALRQLFLRAPRPRILRRAQRGRGTLDVVVVVDGETQGARPALLRPGADVGRRTVVRVLPEGSRRHDVHAVGRQLGRYADSVGTPAAGAALFFGTSDEAVRRFALGDDYDVVLHLGSETDPEVGCDRAASQQLPLAK